MMKRQVLGVDNYMPKEQLRIKFCLLVIVFSCLVGACQAEEYIAYQPSYLPVRIIINDQGEVTIEGEASILTPIGIFSIGADYSLNESSDTTLVVIRNKETGLDWIYRLNTNHEAVQAIVNGKTSIQVAQRQVIVDVTDGNIQSIQFEHLRTGTFISTDSSTLRLLTNQTWLVQEYNFYLTRLAYDDSTINKWYGLGFAFFLLRLVLSAILGLVDLLISFAPLEIDVIWGFGLVIKTWLGQTATNIYFGIVALLYLLLNGFVLLQYSKSTETKTPILSRIINAVLTIMLISIFFLPIVGYTILGILVHRK